MSTTMITSWRGKKRNIIWLWKCRSRSSFTNIAVSQLLFYQFLQNIFIEMMAIGLQQKCLIKNYWLWKCRSRLPFKKNYYIPAIMQPILTKLWPTWCYRGWQQKRHTSWPWKYRSVLHFTTSNISAIIKLISTNFSLRMTTPLPELSHLCVQALISLPTISESSTWMYSINQPLIAVHCSSFMDFCEANTSHSVLPRDTEFSSFSSFYFNGWVNDLAFC